ncbi:MAG: DUF362 domain-containing protein [Candidatus Bathyarchaeia archaeon]
MKDKVAIIRADNYDDVGHKLREGIEAVGGLPDLKEKHIVIKPNLCCVKSSETGATIHVNFVREIINIINEETGGNCRIFVVESDAEGVNADYAFKFLGYTSLEKDFPNVKLVNLSKDAKIEIILGGKALDTLEAPKTLLDMEYMVSIAKLKTHADQRMSCILKNQFGLITKKHKAVFHPILSEVIYDLNSMYKPDLCIVDGIIGMEGFGPTDGMPKKANVILVGTNPIATDIVAAKIMGFKPKQVPHLRLCMKLSNYSENDFCLMGEDVRNVQTKFQFIPLKYYLLARLGLYLQKWGTYMLNFGSFLQKTRSALSLIGFATVNKRVALKDILKIMKDMIFKSPG